MKQYSIRLEPPSLITDLQFPDITKLLPIDRHYDLISAGNVDHKLTPRQLTQLELRSKFVEDLGIASIDEHFLGGKRNRWNQIERPTTLAGRGAVKVICAIRTFTTDTTLICRKYTTGVHSPVDVVHRARESGIFPSMLKNHIVYATCFEPRRATTSGS